MVALYSPPPPATTTIRVPPPPSQHRARRRLTPAVYRRRRLGLAVLVLGVVLAAGEARGIPGGGPLTTPWAVSGAPQPLVVRPLSRITHVHTTHVPITYVPITYLAAPGDTLWSIARRAQPTGDIRPLVDAMAAQRRGRPLQVGERIEVPG